MYFHCLMDMRMNLAYKGAWSQNPVDLNSIEEKCSLWKKMKKKKTNLWAYVSSVWYSVNRKTLIELYD